MTTLRSFVRSGRIRRTGTGLVTALALGLVATACATPTIRTVRDPAIDISRYQTWNWFPRSELPVASLGEDRVPLHQLAVAQIESELGERGLRQTKDAPDLLVTYQLIVRRERHYKRVMSARKSLWSGRTNTVSIHVDPQEIVMDEYDHADLLIAFADGATGELVWAGRLEQRVFGPFGDRMPVAVAKVLDRMGSGTAIDGVEPKAPTNERLLAMVEAGFADRAPSLPNHQLSWESGISEPGPNFEP